MQYLEKLFCMVVLWVWKEPPRNSPVTEAVLKRDGGSLAPVRQGVPLMNVGLSTITEFRTESALQKNLISSRWRNHGDQWRSRRSVPQSWNPGGWFSLPQAVVSYQHSPFLRLHPTGSELPASRSGITSEERNQRLWLNLCLKTRLDSLSKVRHCQQKMERQETETELKGAHGWDAVKRHAYTEYKAHGNKEAVFCWASAVT